MNSTDPIADMLTRIRNAASVSKNEVRLPHSKIKETIANELVKNGFIKNVIVEKGTPRNTIVITINNVGEPVKFTEIVRMSTPGRRYYTGVKEIPRIKNGRGIVLISTSKGVMSGAEAAKARLGGEIICKIY
ncbi:MAG: small subunit ribosomal protein [Patescibacteria group bacterium]|jgi:small subunit ribosomal protein S8|nr:small subunit ribosomal protein [Patescibacteria group bacterium]